MIKIAKEYTDEISRRFERVAGYGYCTIHASELKRWYDQQRITINVWRDLYSRWESFVGARTVNKNKLFVASEGTNFVFIWAEGLSPSQDSWFKDIAFHAGWADADGTLVVGPI